MANGILAQSLRRAVLQKDKGKCCICGYSFGPALCVHHVIPVSFGGRDELKNLALVCANCHSLIHYRGAKRFAGQDLPKSLIQQATVQSASKLEQLIQAIHQARTAAEQNKGLVEGAFTWESAVSNVAHRNKFSQEKREMLAAAIQKVETWVPPQVLTRCSFRLLSKGKYISINAMNYLLFRSPAFPDLGGESHFDCYLIAPVESRLAEFAYAKERDVFRFKHFGAINFGLSYQEVMALPEDDWKAFADACVMALDARKSREWVSNILPS